MAEFPKMRRTLPPHNMAEPDEDHVLTLPAMHIMEPPSDLALDVGGDDRNCQSLDANASMIETFSRNLTTAVVATEYTASLDPSCMYWYQNDNGNLYVALTLRVTEPQFPTHVPHVSIVHDGRLPPSCDMNIVNEVAFKAKYSIPTCNGIALRFHQYGRGVHYLFRGDTIMWHICNSLRAIMGQVVELDNNSEPPDFHVCYRAL